MRDGVPSKWERMTHDEMAKRAAAAHPAQLFSTVQNFLSPTPAAADVPEVHYAPPYADFDSTDPERSQRDMLKLVRFCHDDLDLDDTEIRVWYSGGKGFHVVLAPRAFGVKPSTDLTYIYKKMFGYLKEFLELPTLDASVYSKRRMWRVPNSQHKSGLYKRRLDHDEITDTLGAIQALAATPLEGPLDGDDAFDGREVAQAVSFYARFVDEYADERRAIEAVPVRLIPDAAPGDPVCVTDVMTNGLRKPGDRNKATMILGSYYKDTGRGEDAAITDITDWGLGLGPTFRHPDDRHVKAGTASVIKSVYESDAYHFGCAFIRSLSGPKPTEPGVKRDSIACMGDACPFIKAPEPELGSIPEVHLSAIGDPNLIDKPIRVRLRIAGAADSPYMVPSKVDVFSAADDCDRAGCVLHAAGGSMTLNLGLRDLVALCNVPDAQHKTTLRDMIVKTSCKRFGLTPHTPVAMNEVAAMPQATSVFTSRDGEVEGDYAYKHLFVLGEMGLKVNSYYEVTGKVYPHPRTQKGTMVVTSVESLQDVIEDFSIEDSKPLFKTYDHPTEILVGHLIADMRVNVTKVACRDWALLAVLMTLHSPLYLKYQPDATEYHGGWMQTLILGDTGEAKSQMVERLLRHVNLGDIHSAQTSGRTGLLYTIVNKDTSHNFIQWGAFVLNDRGLLAIDEASGLSKKEYAELRNARRDGVFKVTRSVIGEASTRTRLLILSNPAFGKAMRDTQQGIMATKNLFEDADIRRFDLVIGFTSEIVQRAEIEAALDEKVVHLFTPEVLRANILWAWSRRKEDVHWTPEATKEVKTVSAGLNTKYSGSTIHLLSMDAGEKIARMSQALAATLHSTDDLHQQIVVRAEHVQLVGELVDKLYSDEDLEYDVYVQHNSEPPGTDWDDLEFRLHRKFSTAGMEYPEIYQLFSENATVDSHQMEAICGESKVAKSVTKALISEKLIRRNTRGGGYETTQRFGQLLRRWHHKTGD